MNCNDVMAIGTLLRQDKNRTFLIVSDPLHIMAARLQ